MQLLAKLKNILYIRFRVTLTVGNFEVALSPMYRFFYTLSKVASYPGDQNSILRKKIYRAVFEI